MTIFMRAGSLDVLLAISVLWFALAVRTARRADEQRDDDAVTFDGARAMGMTALLWCGVSFALLLDPRLGGTPLVAPTLYSIATGTILYLVAVALGGCAFLAFRLRHLAGRHEWQREESAG